MTTVTKSLRLDRLMAVVEDMLSQPRVFSWDGFPGGLVQGDVPHISADEAGMWCPEVDTEALARAAMALRERDINGYSARAEALWMYVSDAYAQAAQREIVAENDRREKAAIDAADAVADRVADMARAVESALNGKVCFGRAGYGSAYESYRGVKLRVSDHEQKDGGGWHEGHGCRMGEADISWVVESADEPIPSREEIRAQVARAIRANM